MWATPDTSPEKPSTPSRYRDKTLEVSGVPILPFILPIMGVWMLNRGDRSGKAPDGIAMKAHPLISEKR